MLTFYLNFKSFFPTCWFFSSLFPLINFAQSSDVFWSSTLRHEMNSVSVTMPPVQRRSQRKLCASREHGPKHAKTPSKSFKSIRLKYFKLSKDYSIPILLLVLLSPCKAVTMTQIYTSAKRSNSHWALESRQDFEPFSEIGSPVASP